MLLQRKMKTVVPIMALRLQLRTLSASSFLLLVSKHSSEDLPTGALGNDVDELDTALQPLMSCLVLFDVLID